MASTGNGNGPRNGRPQFQIPRRGLVASDRAGAEARADGGSVRPAAAAKEPLVTVVVVVVVAGSVVVVAVVVGVTATNRRRCKRTDRAALEAKGLVS